MRKNDLIPPEKDFRKSLERLACKHGAVPEVFTDFVALVACSLANQTREEEYPSIARK